MARARSELKRWAKQHLVGVENTLLPSFSPDLSTLDENGIRHDVRQSVAHGFFSTMCATETGLSLEEAKRMVEIAVDEARGDILVTTSLILNNFEENLALLEHAERVGAHGVLLGYPPVFHPEDREEVYEVTKRFCDATSLHVTLYPSPHFPFSKFHRSGFPLDVLDRLVDLDNVVAVKVGELGLFSDVQRRVGDRVLVGCPVERYVPLLVQGFGMSWMGAGCYEVLQSPEKPYLVEYFRLLRDGRVDAGMEIYWKLAPMRNIFEEQFNRTVMTGTYNWHQQKFYQWCVGGNGGLTRQPAMKLHPWEADVIRMGYYAIDIAPRDNDQEFVIGRKNWERLHPVSNAPAAAPSGDRVTLSLALREALTETDAELAALPAIVRPAARAMFQAQTGRSLEEWLGWTGTVEEQSARGEELLRLQAYFANAPTHAARFLRVEERQTFADRMRERARLVGELASALQRPPATRL